ncbi:MAG TPA: hypothetical protein VFI73_02295 [Candidatus Nitrosopolaris sp.]|nr:hypothetical protein [Candidatus Nitrosopolaris sp.]
MMIGTTAAEILTSYWHSRHNQSLPPKVYFFNRRIHHGEIGALLGLSSLFLRGTSVPTVTVAAILTGMGMGLVKDDYLDIMDWFKLTKKNVDQKQVRIPRTKQAKKQATERVNEPQYTCKKPEERCSVIAERISNTNINKKAILEPLRKHIRNLIDTQSQTIKQIESQIKDTQKHLIG